jgi:hypothetical protein
MLKTRGRHAGQIDDRDLEGIGGVPRLRRVALVLPPLHVLPADREAGVDALLDLLPLGVVDDLGADVDRLLGVVELDRDDLAGSDRAVHRADVPEALAVGRLLDVARPLLEQRLRAVVVEDLAGAIGDLLTGPAPHFALLDVDLS